MIKLILYIWQLNERCNSCNTKLESQTDYRMNVMKLEAANAKYLCDLSRAGGFQSRTFVKIHPAISAENLNERYDLGVLRGCSLTGVFPLRILSGRNLPISPRKFFAARWLNN